MKFDNGFIQKLVLTSYEKYKSGTENIYYSRMMELEIHSYPSIRNRLFNNNDESYDILYAYFLVDMEKIDFEKEIIDDKYLQLFDELFNKSNWLVEFPIEHIIILDQFDDKDNLDFGKNVLDMDNTIGKLKDEELKSEFLDKIKQLLVDEFI